MKKTLIALAAVAATGAAFAQSSVTVYGVLDIGYGAKSIDVGAASAKSSGVSDGALNGSRFGFRGTEDLGGGLKADFVLEQGLSPTSPQLTNVRTSANGFQLDSTASSSLTGRSTSSLNRQTFLGLTGGFGTVRIGYQYTNVYELGTLSGYAMGTEGAFGADIGHLGGASYVGGTRANGITYITPSMSGFVAQVQYGAGTGLEKFTHNVALEDDQSKAQRMSVMGKYSAGPLSAAVAYTSFKNGTAADGATALATTRDSLTQVGASYDFGMAKVGLTYNTGKNKEATAAASRDLDSYSVSAQVPFGATRFTVAYHSIDEKDGNNAAVTKGSGYQLGVIHDLSKRTSVYAFWGKNKFDNVTLTVDTIAAAAGATAFTNVKQSDFVVGLRHNF